ncbi:hypothetical protein [Candidatus Halobonum tyrrellensis]|uniref:Uncharacterized protein n=1 Tax=Candidatus Halobonum tyrrellensis G22 TaxID=1324957 RepID=V4GTF3_9EURY|nr:hypothetical protein [Candidatus Halobonum tyrrellensis]ESP88371.1 hypothetical protein K933_09617 [Candidatus Halobonum tyrrellensis G22]
MSGHKVTLRTPDGDTTTLARYPEHEDATSHLYSYCLWDDNHDWGVADDYRSADAADGSKLSVTPAPIHRYYQPGNVEPDPRHGVLDWTSKTTSLDGAEFISCDSSNPDALDKSISANTVGVVIRGLNDYLDQHKVTEVEVPPYYSRIPDDHDEIAYEYDDSDDNMVGLNAGIIEAGIRVLNGSGRYPASEHVLHDCQPHPSVLERESHGAVMLAPRTADPAEA